jgi:hypothetical protein
MTLILFSSSQLFSIFSNPPFARIYSSIVAVFLLIFSLSLPVNAQNYPVQLNLNVATPCPVRLSSLFPGASSRVNLMVLLTDISQPELQVRLRVTLEGPGLTLTTRPEFLPIPFTLYGGMPVSLQTELAPYFTTTSLMASGSAAGSFAQSGMLPEGMYKLTVQAVEHRRNVVVSNTSMAMAWAIYNDPPEPILPTNNQVVDAGNMQNILFTWAPRHILTPGAGGQISYRLSLWEVPTGVNPELAVQTLQPIGTIESYSPTAIWGPDRPMLIPGKQYAYRIQAIDPTGEVAFKNNGNSVVRAFTFGTPCSKPVNLSHSEVTIQSAKTAWVPLGGVAKFAVEYRPALEEPVNWRSYEVQGNSTTLSSLAPATEYKYRVKSVCGSYQSDPTAEKSFTTQPLPNLDNLCTGNAVAPPVDNAPLLNNLESLQVISAGGFLVTIDEVTKTGNTFSGKCRIAMPLLGFSVKGTFKNIQVNSLLQLTSGKVESVKSETLTIIGGNGSNPNGPGTIDFGNITDTVHITRPIDNYHMNPDSTWTVVTTNGDTIIVHPPTNGTGVLVVDPNGNGIVIVGTTAVPYSRDANSNNGTTTPITPTSICDNRVAFTPSGSMHRYGYDPYRQNIEALYQKLQIGTQSINLAYKSVPQGATDMVYVEPLEGSSLNGVTYAYQSGAALTATPTGSGTQSLYLSTPAGGSDNLLALCSMDTATHEAAVAGALRVVSYPLTRHHVVIVPVGSAQPSFSVAQLRTQLNTIYAPAVIDWDVTQLPAVTATYWDQINDGKLQFPATDYSPEMRGVWQAFLASNNPMPGTAYLFIVSAFDSSQYKGYMPIRSIYGFLTPSATPRDAAHELGHGLFNLRHTFSNDNVVKLQKGSTQNLMDYSSINSGQSGSELWKYQWDFTHNPQGGWFVFEDSEEGAVDEETVLGYIVIDENALVRNSLSPYSIKTPKIVLTKGTEVELITHNIKNEIVTVKYVNEIDEYVTSYFNLSKIISLQEKEKYKVLVNKESITLPYSEIKTGNISLKDSYVLADKKCKDYYQVKENTNTNTGWWLHKSCLKRVDNDVSNNFNWMDTVVLETETINQTTLLEIQENRRGVNNRANVDIYGINRLRTSGSGYVYFGVDNGRPTFIGTDFEKIVKEEIYNELCKEGSFSSVNTYDGEVLTLGKGFSVKGQLMNVFKELFKCTNQNYEQILLNVGIKIVNNHFWVVDSDGKWKKDVPPNYYASEYIKSSVELLSFFIELIEKPDYKQDMIDAQYKVLVSGAGNYPSYIINNEKDGYNDNWSHKSVTVLCHLSHWAGYRWNEGTDRYKETNGNLDKIIYEYLYNSVKLYSSLRNEKIIETNIYRWNNNYKILDRLGEWGNPKSAGLDNIEENWNTNKLTLDFKNDKTGKLRAVVTLTKKYITNNETVLIKINDNYFVITKDSNTVTYENFEE